MTAPMTEDKTLQRNHKLQKRLDRLAWFTDGMLPLPGKARIGLDGIIGLIPFVGDAVSALISSYVVGVGISARVPLSVNLRMAFNILVDTIIGAIPLLGDIFDIFFQANRRNVKLLNRYLEDPQKTRRRSRAFGLSLAACLLFSMLLMLWLSYRLLLWFIGLF